MKEEIFDFDKHKGRRIKVLINYPLGGSVKKGEIGVLKYDNVADFPSQSGYSCGAEEYFYRRFELLPEDDVKEPQFEDWCEDNEYIFVTQELKEEELKVGDYAVVLEGYRGSNFTPGNIVKLVLDEEDGFQCLYVGTPYSKNTPFIYTKNLRKATTQEILAETLPTVIVHIKNPFEITNAQENINILPKPKELEIVPISKYFKIRN